MHLSVYRPFNLTPVYSSLAWTICNLRHTKTHFCRSFSRLACWLTLIELFLRKNAAIESTAIYRCKFYRTVMVNDSVLLSNLKISQIKKKMKSMQ